MSSTTGHVTENTAADPVGAESRIPRPPPRRPDPEPVTDPNYYKGRHAVARGSGKPRPILLGIMLDLNVEQSTWVHEESKRAGAEYEDIIKALIDREIAARR
jgi:hypothetical protein